MAIDKASIRLATILVGKDHAKVLLANAKKIDKIESTYRKKARKTLRTLDEWMADYMLRYREVPKDVPIEIVRQFLMDMYLETATEAVEQSQQELGVVGEKAHLGGKRWPGSLKKIQEIYDKWRRTKVIPKRQKEVAEAITKAYVKKCQEVWKEHSEDFIQGRVADQEEALKVIKSASDGVYSRAKMIVDTETTTYYNQTKRDYYDGVEAVTHYLFLAIRDQRTSKWCTDRTTDGKRGRHGLVYAKGDPLTVQETPSIHWNCRSEMVPLVQQNPRHKKLIEDSSKHRRSHQCYPLPKGWNK